MKKGGTYLNVLKSSVNGKQEDLVYLKELFETGALKPVVDRIYPLEEIVEAHRYVDKEHKKGHVVLCIN